MTARNDGQCFQCDIYRDAISETARTADELAFWRYQAIWYRAAIAACDCTRLTRRKIEAQLEEAEQELERRRADENRERYAHAEPPREIGS